MSLKHGALPREAAPALLPAPISRLLSPRDLEACNQILFDVCGGDLEDRETRHRANEQ